LWKMKKKALLLVLAGILAFNLIGCASGQKAGTGGESSRLPEQIETISQQDLAIEILAKYGNNDKNEYLPRIDPVPRDHRFYFHLYFNPKEFPEYYTATYDLIGVFADPDFRYKLPMKWETTWINENELEILVGPGDCAAAAIQNYYGSVNGQRKISEDFEDIKYVDDKGSYNDWGNLPRYYLVLFADSETGEKLEKPLVQVFTIQAELEAPVTTVFADHNGRLSLRWEPVEGAERYVIYSFNYFIASNEAYTYYWPGKTLDVVDGYVTEWHAANNNEFRQVDAPMFRDPDPEVTIEGTNLERRGFYQETIGVIALGKDGHSSMDNLHRAKDFIHLLSYELAENDWGEIDYRQRWLGMGADLMMLSEGISEMPSQISVYMCDGTIVNKTVEYDFAGAKVQIERVIDPKTDSLVDLNVFAIGFRLPQTGIMGICKLENPPDTWKTELAHIRSRQEALARAGTVKQMRETIQQRHDAEGDPTGGDSSGMVEVLQVKVFASNALSEYLAVNMLAGKTSIPLTAFPQASDTEFLTDALFEAYYQNPLILGITDMYLDKNYNLIIEYEDAPDVRSRKQDQVQSKINEIIPQIITPSMTALEKEIAINAYLCDRIEYDMPLLEEAQKNNYRNVDPKYNDSFTIYGALINEVCVCAGYAAAFQMLARAAGLEAIVVTGTLEGYIGHAWNRVYIDNEWMNIDPTNNDNVQLYNGLFNLPDYVVEGYLIEDRDFMLDSELHKYYATKDSSEYYHVKGGFYEKELIVDRLAEGVARDGSIVLRTDYDISDSEYRAIAREVKSRTGINDLYGCHLLGLIYLSTESF